MILEDGLHPSNLHVGRIRIWGGGICFQRNQGLRASLESLEYRLVETLSNPVQSGVCIPSSERFWRSGSMAQVCEICGKKPMSGNTISHAHNVSKRRWNVNLRPVHARVGATTKRMRVCTSCLRSGKVVKA